jgi:hypothetical protein
MSSCHSVKKTMFNDSVPWTTVTPPMILSRDTGTLTDPQFLGRILVITGSMGLTWGGGITLASSIASAQQTCGNHKVGRNVYEIAIFCYIQTLTSGSRPSNPHLDARKYAISLSGVDSKSKTGGHFSRDTQSPDSPSLVVHSSSSGKPIPLEKTIIFKNFRLSILGTSAV